MHNYDDKFLQFKKGILDEFSPLINRAYKLAEYAHKEQYRKSGDPYLTHPVSIMNYLRSMGLNTDTLVIALLHDVVEDTTISIKDIEDLFSPEIALTVYFLSKDHLNYFKDKESRNAAYLHKLEAGFCYHYNVYLVKLIDRFHNLSTFKDMKAEKQYSKIKETLMIYMPLFKNYIHLVPKKHKTQCEKIITDMDEIIADYINNQ